MLEELRAYENDLLDKHISFFELIRREDEDELASRYDVVSVNIHKVAVSGSLKSKKRESSQHFHFTFWTITVKYFS